MVGIPGGGGGIGGGSKKRIQAYQSSTAGIQTPPEGPMPVDGPVSRLAGGPGSPSGALPPAPRPSVRHDDAPPQAMPPPRPRSEDEGADMSRYEMPMPEGETVMWEDQQRAATAMTQQQAMVFAATPAPATRLETSIMEKLRTMPPWAWLLIFGGFLIFGVIVGFAVKSRTR